MHALTRGGAAIVVTAGVVSVTATLPHGSASARQIPAERHLHNIRQLTFGGQNAEAYFSPDGQSLIFQSTRDGYPCDQIYTMRIDGGGIRRVSTGSGRTTCGYYYPGGKEILFASTHRAGAQCPPKPSYDQGYVWPLYEGYEIYRANADGSNLRPLTMSPGYDAEATIAPDGLIAFTSVRDGDIEIYTMRADGSDVRRLTYSPGPDGGPFFSWDGAHIAYRAHPLQPGAELDDYLALLKQHLFRPTKLEIYVMDRDGKNQRQLTTLNAASFAPSWTPDDKRIVFASNVKDPGQRNFDIFIMNADGSGLEQVTFNETFDGFPMFSPDGKHLVFASNRNGKVEGETNVFIADWVE
jgi:Tol biopolymer transport system component